MTTDNRTNEPTEAQVEAAVHAAWVKSREFRGVGGQAEFAPPWEFQQVIRAALVAAQGAAPQAESVSKSSYISPSLPAQIRGLYRADLRERSIQTMLDLAGDLIQELIDLKAAPVLPSSGVDEDKLAEVILAAEYDYRNAEFIGDPDIGTLALYQARAVAEWLKGQ